MKKLTHGLMAVALILVSGVVFFACNSIDKKLTLENYNAIVLTEGDTEGWTFAKVKEKLGTPTGETKELTDGAGELVWANKDDTKSITVTFTDSRASQKSQKGLNATE